MTKPKIPFPTAGGTWHERGGELIADADMRAHAAPAVRHHTQKAAAAKAPARNFRKSPKTKR